MQLIGRSARSALFYWRIEGDPYQIASQVLKTIASVPTESKVSAAA